MTTKVIKFIESKYQLQFDLTETVKVLKHNLNIFWSWGVAKQFNFDNKALVLKVNARRHKGYVAITLAWSDTYSVYLINTNGKVVKEFEMVYFDQLTQIIDNEIERIPIYQQ